MERKNYRDLLPQKQYMKLLFADLVSRFGDSLDAIAYSWIMYEVTGSESLMALILGLNYLPTVLLQPFAGALADRISKKALMAAADAIRFGLVALLVVLYENSMLTAWGLAGLTLCTSAVEAFRMPAGNAVMPLLLEPECYTVGKAASYTVSRVSCLAGFVAAGGLIAQIGAAGVLWIDAAAFAVSAAVVLTLRMAEVRGKGEVNLRQVFRDFREGLEFLRKAPAIQTIGAIGVVINFGLMPLSVFQTPFISDYLLMGPEALSYIKVLMMVGMMGGAAVTPGLLRFRKSRICIAAGAGMGGAILGLYGTAAAQSAVGRLLLLTLCMLCVGIGGGVLNVVIGSCMMAAVPQDRMGRMSGLNSAMMEASMPAGSFLCSALVLKLRVTELFLLFGAATVFFYLLMGAARRLDSLDQAGA